MLSLCTLPSAPIAASTYQVPYDVVVLDPAGGEALGVDRSRAVGTSVQGYPAVWNGGPSNPVRLQVPPDFRGATPLAISGSEVVGAGEVNAVGLNPHALLWNGTVPTDLHPAGLLDSNAFATDGAQQVGFADDGTTFFAALWTGTARSYQSLNPPGWSGRATGVWHGAQVGYGGAGHAVLWHGTPGSMVDLQPSGPGRDWSQAFGTSHGQIVGVANWGQVGHAALWTGSSASSFVDLQPAIAVSSELLATNGTQQVGDDTGAGRPKAAVWHGSAATFEPLPDVIARQGYDETHALAIDNDGNIAGWMSSTAILHPQIPVLWVPRRIPGDADFDGKVDFSDLLILARNYGQSGDVGFVDGDFDMDGSVGFDDLVILARNYGGTVPTASQLAQFDPAFRADVERAFADVPEPSLALWLAAAAGLFIRQHRCR